ncbi:M55 family metallopeptidase [Planctomycetota bacterium]
MKIYIMTDMEGASGIRYQDECKTDGPMFDGARRYLMGDVNAAVAGCFDGGADEVVVNGRVFDISKMDPRASYETEVGGWHSLPSLDETFDGLMVVGGHAMAGTQGAFLDHTQSSLSWFNYSINGENYGEIGQWTAMAGHFDVPLIFVAGDQAACDEVNRQFPGAATVAVKRAMSRNKAHLTLSPERAHEVIRTGAKDAIKLTETVKPWKLEPPIEVVLEYCRSDYAENVAHHPGVERVDARTVRKIVQTAKDVMSF